MASDLQGLSTERGNPAPPESEARWNGWRARAVLAFLALLAYSNSFSPAMLLDAQWMTMDTRIRALSLENLRLILTTSYKWPLIADGLYRPVTTLSMLLNYAVLGNGANGIGYHVVNFLLHVINIWLVHALFRRIFKNARWALAAAALWAVHPVSTEAVTNVVGRADLIAAMAILLGLLLYDRLPSLEGHSRWAAIAGLLFAATVGVFAKESAAVLIGLVILWDLSRFHSVWASRLPRIAAYVAVDLSLVCLFVIRQLVLGRLPLRQVIYIDNPIQLSGFIIGRWTALKIVAMNLQLLAWPARLSCDHSFHDIALASPSDFGSWLSLAVVLGILVAALVRYRRDRPLFFAICFFAITLAPTSNLLLSIGASRAERFLYLPSVGFVLATVLLVSRALSPKMAAIVLTAAVLLCTARTFDRNFAWHDSLSLASTDLRVSPNSFRLHQMMSQALYAKDPEHNLDQAIAEQENAWKIVEALPPRYSAAAVPLNLGRDYLLKGDTVGGPSSVEGRRWYEKSAAVLLRAREISRVFERVVDDQQRAAGKPLTVRAADPDLYLNLSAALIGLGKYAEAEQAARYGQGLAPYRSACYEQIAEADLEMGDPGDAVVAIEEEGILEGFPSVVSKHIVDLYGRFAKVSCAIPQRESESPLNLKCPQVARDLCRASAQLAAAYREARIPPPARLSCR